MDPELPSAESAFPPPPPLLPPPVPPPLMRTSEPKDGETSLWRWNDRLALVAGGLTLFLLGIFAGRLLRPERSSETEARGHIAAVVAAPQAAEAESTVPAQPASQPGEVNPELVLDSEPAEIVAPPADPAPTSPASSPTRTEVAVEKTEGTSPSPAAEPAAEGDLAASETPVSKEIASASSPEATGETSPPPAAPQQTVPVSIGTKVPTIKPLVPTQVCEATEKFKDRKLSTALTWAESVQEASQQAEEEEKLVFLIHVSGNFELPGFT